jgi:hypothetical protein
MTKEFELDDIAKRLVCVLENINTEDNSSKNNIMLNADTAAKYYYFREGLEFLLNKNSFKVPWNEHKCADKTVCENCGNESWVTYEDGEKRCVVCMDKHKARVVGRKIALKTNQDEWDKFNEALIEGKSKLESGMSISDILAERATQEEDFNIVVHNSSDAAWNNGPNAGIRPGPIDLVHFASPPEVGEDKCLCGETLVWTNKGLMRMSDIFQK